jgi:hypothetical protein
MYTFRSLFTLTVDLNVKASIRAASIKLVNEMALMLSLDSSQMMITSMTKPFGSQSAKARILSEDKQLVWVTFAFFKTETGIMDPEKARERLQNEVQKIRASQPSSLDALSCCVVSTSPNHLPVASVQAIQVEDCGSDGWQVECETGTKTSLFANTDDQDDDTGKTAGIAIGVCLGIVILVGGIYYVWKMRHKRDEHYGIKSNLAV